MSEIKGIFNLVKWWKNNVDILDRRKDYSKDNISTGWIYLVESTLRIERDAGGENEKSSCLRSNAPFLSLSI